MKSRTAALKKPYLELKSLAQKKGRVQDPPFSQIGVVELPTQTTDVCWCVVIRRQTLKTGHKVGRTF
jgi:hypothetical protein